MISVTGYPTFRLAEPPIGQTQPMCDVGLLPVSQLVAEVRHSLTQKHNMAVKRIGKVIIVLFDTV